MNNNEAVNRVRQWAKQTIVFAMSVGNASKPKGPLEILEQTLIVAQNLADRLFAESIADCGTDDRPERVMAALVTRVLDWVVEYRQGS